MRITTKNEPYDIPKYSLTGDLLSFLGCGLQYRFNNKGSMPPSVPVQLWFGEFIHGVMEEAFLMWKEGQFDIDQITFEEVQSISVKVADRLEVKGLRPYANLFQREDTPDKKCKNCLANQRAFKSLYVWAPHLFPLVEGNEVPLENIRAMPDTSYGARSDFYAMTGVADVITSIKISEIATNNRIMQYLTDNDIIKEYIDRYDEFEIVIDYKGTMRPNLDDKTWEHHRWQLNTYMWLRKQQLISEGKDYPVIGGFLLYLSELRPSDDFCKKFYSVVQSRNTDVLPEGYDLDLVKNGKPGRERFLMDRCIRVIPFDEGDVQSSLKHFDDTVKMIETNVQSEMRNSKDVMSHWKGTPKEENCTACDAKTFCPYAKGSYPPTVP